MSVTNIDCIKATDKTIMVTKVVAMGSMSVTNINCNKATGKTIMVTKVVAKGSFFNTIDIFYRHTMAKLFKIAF